MRIVHVVIANKYIEGAGYQENILPAFHKQQGHEVWLIATKSWFGTGNANITVSNESQYCYDNPDGLHVIIMKSYDSILNKIPVLRVLTRKTVGLYDQLCEIHPDILFIHGLQAFDSLDALRYVKNYHNTKLFVDQHADYYNSPVSNLKQKIIQKGIFRYIAQKLVPYTVNFWGVTPWRVQYLKDIYKIPEDKIGLLVMGGDDRFINWNEKLNIRNKVRKQNNIPEDAFLLITGGKIDDSKNIGPLIDFMKKHYQRNVFLLVFGKYDDKWAKIIEDNKSNNVINIGWIGATDVYDYFLASDLGCFLGTHSVLWESCVACGTPMIVNDWSGMHHIDIGGNCKFVNGSDKDELINTISHIIDVPNEYNNMVKAANTERRKDFLYSNIAKRAINDGQSNN